MKVLFNKLFMLLVLALIAGWTHAQTPDLFFSEYIEGNSNNKALEIYNPTSDTVFLENYRITMATNGANWSATWRTFPNGSYILPGDVWVMINSSTSALLFNSADADEVVTGTSSIVTFNGDDARGLVKISATDTTWLDIFGNPAADPGSGWQVGTLANATVNHTLVRKPEYNHGNTNWETSFANEWDIYDVDVFTYLGMHTLASTTASLILNVNMNYQITAGFFNPLVDSVDVAGNFNGWAGTSMSDIDMDGIYSCEIPSLNVGDTAFFKFRINASWNTCELSTGSNREYILLPGTNTQNYWYDNNSGPQTVTFTVNDQPATSLNIKMKGSWDNWALHQMYDDGTNGDLVSGDHIWTAQVSVPGGTWEWGAIEDDGSQWGLWLIQGSNMVVTVATDGTVSGQTSYEIPVPSGNEFIVFHVNMNYQISLGTFNPLTDSIDVAGSFSFWGSAGNFIDMDGDGIYSNTIGGFTAGEVIEFKFRINGNWNTAEFPNGGPNRSYTVVGGGADIITYWYNNETPPNLYFSEYIEGSSNNKGLEIYNPSSLSVSLDSYRIAQATNGGGWTYYHTFPVGASIAPGDVWVIIANQVATSLFDYINADEVLAYPSVTHHNGDDARALIQIVGTDTLWLDVFGNPSNDPGTGWPVAGIANATADKTLVRKASITMGNTDWQASFGTDAANSEWVVLPSNTFTYLGSHPHPELTSGAVTFNVNMNYQQALGVFNPAVDFVDVAGTFNNWSGSGAMSDLDGDGIYSITVQNLEPDTIFFKFRINGNWNTSENISDRQYIVILGNQSVTYWYSNLEPVTNLSIYDIQYTADPSGNSPYMGQTVATKGIVTAVQNNGYYIQDGNGPWSGVFVYDQTNFPVLGDSVSITAVVAEYFNLTELTPVSSYTVLNSGNTLPAAQVVTVGTIKTTESYEGVLVKVENATLVTLPNSYGEWYISDGTDTCQLDDLMFAYTGILGNQYDITGVIGYGFGSFEFLPRFASDIVDVTVYTVSQTIPLVAGWRMISTYVIPDAPNCVDVFADVISHLVIVKSGNGSIYWTNYNLNTIGNVALGQGYQINMSMADTLVVTGVQAVPENVTLSLPASWSILGYLRDVPGNAITMMSPVVNAGGLIIMKNGIGSVYWPAYGLNSIGNMNPGEGYQIKLSAATSFTYPANSGASKSEPAQPILVKPTGANMTIGFPSSNWDYTPAVGSVISAYNSHNQLVGQSIYQGGNFALTVWGDDEITSQKDGSLEYEALTFDILNQGLRTPIQISYWEEGDGTYKTNDIQVAGHISAANAFALSANPNPASTQTEIEVCIPANDFLTVELYNILGEKVRTLYNQSSVSGKIQLSLSVSGLSEGSYFVKASAGNETITRRLQVVR